MEDIAEEEKGNDHEAEEKRDVEGKKRENKEMT